MNKHFLTGLFACVLILMTGCGQEHTHTPAEQWSFDINNHWHSCQCKESLDSEAHTLTDNTCSVCGSEVLIQEDGTAQLSRYDEYDRCILSVSYTKDEKGNWMEGERQEYEVNQNGDILCIRNYRAGFLYLEIQHQISTDGEITSYIETEYWEDESKVIYEYDANHALIRKTAYDPAGLVIGQ